jgi:DNA-binding CsgD family transcriptional regulator
MLVARRHLDSLVALAALEGLPRELVAPDLTPDLVRVPWETVVRATHQLVEAAGGAQALADTALASSPGPELTVLAQGEPSVDELLSFVVEQLLPGDFPLMRWRFTQRREHAWVVTTTMQDGYPPCPPFWLLLAASFQTLPRLFGLPDALVRSTSSEHGARFRIETVRLPAASAVPRRSIAAPSHDAADGLIRLLDDAFQQRAARDQTMAALASVGDRRATHASPDEVAERIARTLCEQLGLSFVWVWGSSAPGRPARRLAGVGERSNAPSRAIALVAHDHRVGYLEIPRDSPHTEWLEAGAAFLAVELADSDASRDVASTELGLHTKATAWKLTARQKAVVENLAAGASNKEIAVALGCAVTTVEEHLTAIYRKAGVSGRYPLLATLLTP